jgi:hypothetical protein
MYIRSVQVALYSRFCHTTEGLYRFSQDIVPFSPVHFVKDFSTIRPSLKENTSTKIREDIV